MTQGIISITKKNKVIFKCVAGCNGFNAKKTAKAIQKKARYDLQSIYDICVKNDFGDKDCSLIVQSENDWIGAGRDESKQLPKLYTEKFNDADFNPRWEYGTAPHTEIIKLK